MERAEHHEDEVHPEVVDLEDLRLGQGEHEDPDELGKGDAVEDGGSHPRKGNLRPEGLGAIGNGESPYDMDAELQGDTDGHGQVRQ